MNFTALEGMIMPRVFTQLRVFTAAVCLAALPLPGFAAFPDPAAPHQLFIQILEGEGALNDIRSRTAREPIVEIDDENHKPVAGAIVIFSSPSSGPSAVFSNGLNSFKVTTGADGRATALGVKPNNSSGQFQIQVSASFGTLSTVAVINETNTGKGSSPQQHAHGLPVKVIIIVAAVAGGAVAGGLLLSGGSSHSDTVTAGTPTVGAP
jgi:hypothetical protein